MKSLSKKLPLVGGISLVALLLTLMFSFNANAAQPTNDEALVPCSEQLALEAVKSSEAVKECVKKAQDNYPGRQISVNVTTSSGCGTSQIRGCTYVVTISLSFPCPNPPFCLAGPDILVLQAGVDCLYNVTYVNCYI